MRVGIGDTRACLHVLFFSRGDGLDPRRLDVLETNLHGLSCKASGMEGFGSWLKGKKGKEKATEKSDWEDLHCVVTSKSLRVEVRIPSA